MRLSGSYARAMQNNLRTNFFSYSKYVSYGVYYTVKITGKIPKKSRL